MKTYIVTLASMILSLFGWYLGGFDFDQRNGWAVFCYVSTLIAGFYGFLIGREL